MGCWNETCILTRSPILFGEKCGAFIIKDEDFKYKDDKGNDKIQPADPISSCYDFQSALSNVVTYVEGEYDDYGRIRGHENLFEHCRGTAHIWLSSEAIEYLKAYNLEPRTLEHIDGLLFRLNTFLLKMAEKVPDIITEKEKKEIENTLANKDAKVFFAKLYMNIIHTRMSFDPFPSGYQHEEFDDSIKMHELATQRLKSLKALRDKQREEDEKEDEENA